MGGRMLVLVDGGTGSSSESSAMMLRDALGARILGCPTYGSIEYGNIAPYVLPASGMVVTLPTRWNEVDVPVEVVGVAPDLELDVTTPAQDLAREFDDLWDAASR